MFAQIISELVEMFEQEWEPRENVNVTVKRFRAEYQFSQENPPKMWHACVQNAFLSLFYMLLIIVYYIISLEDNSEFFSLIFFLLI